MTQVTIRELTHGFSGYIKAVKRGEKIVILERRTPVADLIPHNENLAQPGWKRPISKIKVKGIKLSSAVSKIRDEER
ncbi:MAG: hypothetical protein HY583_02590 [Candidatus Omnitrophica bacterium]|nr:hypothetical protein [Candidatus Omnitrophota bacterium]